MAKHGSAPSEVHDKVMKHTNHILKTTRLIKCRHSQYLSLLASHGTSMRKRPMVLIQTLGLRVLSMPCPPCLPTTFQPGCRIGRRGSIAGFSPATASLYGHMPMYACRRPRSSRQGSWRIALSNHAMPMPSLRLKCPMICCKCGPTWCPSRQPPITKISIMACDRGTKNHVWTT